MSDPIDPLDLGDLKPAYMFGVDESLGVDFSAASTRERMRAEILTSIAIPPQSMMDRELAERRVHQSFVALEQQQREFGKTVDRATKSFERLTESMSMSLKPSRGFARSMRTSSDPFWDFVKRIDRHRRRVKNRAQLHDSHAHRSRRALRFRFNDRIIVRAPARSTRAST